MIERPIPSQTTLEETLHSAIRFLSAAGTRAPIRRQLQTLGYTPAEHSFGWKLVHASTGFDPNAPQDAEVLVDYTIRAAFVELDGSDETWFRQIRASLVYSHPDVAERVLANLKPATGPAAAASAGALAERVADLRKTAGKSPEQIERDQDAADKLARRGFDEAWIARVRELVATTQRLDDSPEAPQAEPDPADPQPREALLQLYYWYKEWSELARTRITRRDWLISLGVAARRASAPTQDTPTTPQEPAEDPALDDEA